MEDLFRNFNQWDKVDCSLVNDNGFLVIIGLVTLIMAVMYFSFHFTKTIYRGAKDFQKAFSELKEGATTKKSYFSLLSLEAISRFWGPMAFVGLFRSAAIAVAFYAAVSIVVFVRSGCL